MLSRGRGVASLALVLAAACARIEPPPGGPPDQVPPKLVRVRPESLAVLPGFDGDVEFLFDEVVSEGSQPSEGFGTGDLEKLILLSPTSEVPKVGWKRNRITVRPREGWRPNTVYRVQLLPGVSDVRNNRPQGGGSIVVTFTTGAPVPDFALTGKVYDWNTAQPARGALLEAVLEPDSLVYRAATDSAGGIRFGPLPRGRYTVFATVDQNRNGRRDRRESYDSVRVEGDSGLVPELWMFARDTTPPKGQAATVMDSVTIAVQFNQKLDPALRLDSTAVTVLRLPDSTAVAVRSILTPAQHDSAYKKAPADSAARRDSLAPAAPDTTKARPPAPGAEPAPGKQAPPAGAPPKAPAGQQPAKKPAAPAPAQQPAAGQPALKPIPDSGKAAIARLDSLLPKGKDTTKAKAKPSRPALQDKLLIRLVDPVVPGTRYAIDVRGVRNPSGATGDTRTGLAVPERPKPKADTAKADSLKAPGDSLAPPTDSVPPREGAPPAPRDTLPADPRKQAPPKR